jgi:hypothetical protein
MTRMDRDLADASENLSHGADVCMHADDATTCVSCDWSPRSVSDTLLHSWRHTKRVAARCARSR